MKADDDTSARRIPAGSCTWCGHKPHAATCPSNIRVAKAQTSPCPCPKTTTEEP